MNGRLRAVLVVAAVLTVAILVWLAWSPRWSDADVISGYVEGDDLYLSSPVAGTVTAVKVVKGQRVAAGDPLFAMDPATLSAQEGQAQARLDQTRAQIGAAEAQANQAEAAADAARAVEANARRDYERLASLQKSNAAATSAREVDQAKATADSASAQRLAADKAAAAARVQAEAAKAGAAQASQGLKEAGVRLGQLSKVAPVAGRIEDVFYQEGEWAGPNQPVVSLLPDGQVKLRFFVPEKTLDLYRPGRTVSFSCDGCREGLQARISYVSPRAEFTPPVIYSRKTRDKLVFMVEAVPADAAGLRPGLPVDVRRLGKGEDAKP
jgi:HlyD family secretion protein